MSKPTPNRKIIAIVLSAAFVVITLLTGVLASIKNNPYQDADKPPSSDVAAMNPQDEPSSEQEATGSSEGEQPADTPEEKTAEEPVFFNIPSEMRAVTLVAGRDYMTAPTDTARATLASQIDKALNDAKELTMNSIIIDTKYKDSVLFKSSVLPMVQVDLDCTDYIVTKAREMGFYVYATYDVSNLADNGGNYVKASSADGETLDDVAANIGAFAESYELDGILLSNYYNEDNAASYVRYNENGGGIGYGNYLKQVPQALVTAAAGSVREHAPGTQVGLLAQGVWENSSVNPEGTETKAEFTALGNGNADTRAFVKSGLFDFVMVENFGSTNEQTARFGVVAEWWSKIAQDAGVTLYIMHASDRVGAQSTGWTVYEQLTKQVIDLEEISGVSGSAFNSLKALLANPGNSTTTLVQYMNDQVDQAWVLEQLAVTKPAQMTYKTKEPTVTFQGASQPGVDVTVNGEKIPTNESGYFTITEDLKEGLNTFAISHKGKTFTYNITREIIVLKEIQPTGSISVDGGMAVTVTALAYEGSSVTASVGGQNITLSPSETDDDDTDRDSGYQLYVGVFTAPSASNSATKMGTITVTATSADGVSKTLEGAAVTVNKKAKMGDGVVVQVTAEQAETFSVNTLNDNSSPSYFPLPQGTVDKTYGDEIIYKDGKKTYSYWKLESGLRVYAGDITTGGQMPDNNAISSMSVKSSGAYTTVSLTTGSKVPYKVEYDGNKIVFKFEYTASTPSSETFDSDNALFKSAEWSGSNLTLGLKKTGGFLGYKAYYEGANKLVLRFNNSPGSLSGARVVVDPGHGGNDPGALGFYPGKDEADINLEVAKKLVSELKSRGASVLMVSPGSTMASRLSAARAFNPQVLVSVHGNSNSKASVKGTEVYYFYPFQKQLAANIAANVSASLNTDNRGPKSGLYYMTREVQFASVLMEMGFVSNESEYTKLINSKYQNRIAEGVANAVSGYLGGTNSGGGTSSVDEEEEVSEEVSEEEEDSSETDGGSDVSGVTLNKNTLKLSKNETYTLTATVKPSSASNKKVKWASDDEDVATVSSSGEVKAVGEGSAWITVTTKDGDYSADCEVTVGEQDRSGGLITSISISGDSSIKVGTRTDLTAKVTPSNAQDPGVKWYTSDSSVALLSNNTDSSVKVEGLKNGTVTITAQAYDDGKVKKTFKMIIGNGENTGSSSSSRSDSDVTPKKGVLIDSISISGSSRLPRGTRQEYTASITPDYAEDPGVKWSVTDSDILELTTYSGDKENTCKVEGLRTGSAYLVATAYDSGKALKKFKITVS
ncbi:N-acetylmuramoyl-L-alanine amidase [Oscillospiraceae bacterium PP1C4]